MKLTTTYKHSKNFREHLKSVGFFDGRFAPKAVTDKKKQAFKEMCRKPIDF